MSTPWLRPVPECGYRTLSPRSYERVLRQKAELEARRDRETVECHHTSHHTKPRNAA